MNKTCIIVSRVKACGRRAPGAARAAGRAAPGVAQEELLHGAPPIRRTHEVDQPLDAARHQPGDAEVRRGHGDERHRLEPRNQAWRRNPPASATARRYMSEHRRREGFGEW
jgi:hypothetical protein